MLEMLLVLAILAVITAIALPDFSTMRGNQAVQSAVKELHSVLLAARTQAISKGVEAQVTIDFDQDTITSSLWSGASYDALSEKVTGAERRTDGADWVDANASGVIGSLTGFKTFQFKRRGTVGRAGISSTYSVLVRSSLVSHQYYIKVNNITGKITMLDKAS